MPAINCIPPPARHCVEVAHCSLGVMLPKTDALLADIENFRIWRAKRARRVAPASSCAPQAIFLAPERPILMIFTHFCAQRSSMRAAEFVPGKRGPRQNHVHEIRPFQARPQLHATLTQCTAWIAQSLAVQLKRDATNGQRSQRCGADAWPAYCCRLSL